MRLVLLYPELPTCADCERYVYDPRKHWQPMPKRGRPGELELRPPGTELPCRQCPKIGQGEPPTPETGKRAELSQKNWRAFLHYLTCKAVGRFPRDAIVERNAGLIRLVEDQSDRTIAKELPASVFALWSAKK